MLERVANNPTPQNQHYGPIKNKILTLENWTRAFHRTHC
ncbi:hypothetical protein I600_3402 [Maribacter dokdonensis DSW-8]|nr:hypothetical protein I600_3402 [Maribacter dokdonensis DSW-8]